MSMHELALKNGATAQTWPGKMQRAYLTTSVRLTWITIREKIQAFTRCSKPKSR